MATLDRPQESFAVFVEQAIELAKAERGWTAAEVATKTGIGRSTLFRWLSGDWSDYPELKKVLAFCTALGTPVSAALVALGIPYPAGAVSGPRTQAESDLQTIRERLADPDAPMTEKKRLRDGLRQLARPQHIRG